MKTHDIELMQLADGEIAPSELLREPGAQAKVDAVGEMGELVRGDLEHHAEQVPARRFEAMWREIDKAIEHEQAHAPPKEESTQVGHVRANSFWRRLSRWFEGHRGYLITGVVSAGAVAALAIVLRGPGESGTQHGAISVQPAAYRPTEIESLDTPEGTSTVFHVKDEEGASTVIWVTPADTVEGI
jgi:hypothetical protein